MIFRSNFRQKCIYIFCKRTVRQFWMKFEGLFSCYPHCEAWLDCKLCTSISIHQIHYVQYVYNLKFNVSLHSCITRLRNLYVIIYCYSFQLYIQEKGICQETIDTKVSYYTTHNIIYRKMCNWKQVCIFWFIVLFYCHHYMHIKLNTLYHKWVIGLSHILCHFSCGFQTQNLICC